MNILWLTWKDTNHPEAGGAEVVLGELSARLLKEGHSVTFLTAGYQGAAEGEHSGVKLLRAGSNRYLHSFQALYYYLRHLRNKFDIVVEVVNTAPYFSVFFGKKTRRALFYHQLAREIWFHETKTPLAQLGYYILEPLATRLLSRAKVPVITVSQSTRQDLARFGFKPEATHIISEGIQIQPVSSLTDVRKFPRPTMLSLGTIRPMKRTHLHIPAFEEAKKRIPDLQLKIAGSANSPYGQEVLRAAKNSPYASDIEYLGRVNDEEKADLMRRAHVFVVTSLKEGWGLIVTEAASQGTPSVVFDADGLRDSVRHGETGLIVSPHTAESLADGVVQMLRDQQRYHAMQRQAWQWSQSITFDKAYKDFKQGLGIA